MNRKVLYAIIIVLALVLIAGVVFIMVASNPTEPAQPVPNAPESTADSAVEQPSQSEKTGDAPAAPEQTDTQQPNQAEDATAAGDSEVVTPNGETEATQAPSTEQTEQKPTESTGPLIPNAPEVSVPSEDKVTYQDYHAMSGDEQAAFINTFDSYEAFFEWYNAAEQEYLDNRTPIEEDGKIDLGGN